MFLLKSSKYENSGAETNAHPTPASTETRLARPHAEIYQNTFHLNERSVS